MSSNQTPETVRPDGWEDAELATLRDGLKLSFRERLLWLEGVVAFAEKFGGSVSGRRLDRDNNIVAVVREETGPNTYRVR